MADERAIFQRSKGFQIQESDTGALTALNFKTDIGVVTIAVDHLELNVLVSEIVRHATTIAEKPKARTELKTVTFDPLPARAAIIGRGPTDESVLLGVEMGNVILNI